MFISMPITAMWMSVSVCFKTLCDVMLMNPLMASLAFNWCSRAHKNSDRINEKKSINRLPVTLSAFNWFDTAANFFSPVTEWIEELKSENWKTGEKEWTKNGAAAVQNANCVECHCSGWKAARKNSTLYYLIRNFSSYSLTHNPNQHDAIEFQQSVAFYFWFYLTIIPAPLGMCWAIVHGGAIYNKTRLVITPHAVVVAVVVVVDGRMHPITIN